MYIWFFLYVNGIQQITMFASGSINYGLKIDTSKDWGISRSFFFGLFFLYISKLFLVIFHVAGFSSFILFNLSMVGIVF